MTRIAIRYWLPNLNSDLTVSFTDHGTGELTNMRHLAKPHFSLKWVHFYGICFQKVRNYGTHVYNYGTFGCKAKTATIQLSVPFLIKQSQHQTI